MRKTSPLNALILVSGLLAQLACGGSRSTPTGPSSVVATPTVTPSRAPINTPALTACDRLDRVTQKSACNVTSGSLTNDVSDAIDRVIGSRADLFEMTATNTRGDPHILNQDGYYQAVIAELDKADICAARVSPTELDIHVTNSYNYSDRYQIMTGYAYPWRGKASYVETCTPAALPKAEIEGIDWVFVTAYGVTCVPGAVLTHPFVKGNRAQIPFQCDGSVTATPKTRGGLDVPESIHGNEVEWTHVSGEVSYRVWADQPFNITVSPGDVGPFTICAAVKGVTGCLDGTFVP